MSKLANLIGLFHDAKSVMRWKRAAWYVPLGVLVGFLALYLLPGWSP